MIHFGFEDEDDATFIILADCRHIIHAPSMDYLVKEQAEAEDQAIKMIECPKCKTSVKKTSRYNGFINKQLKKVEAVKKKYRGEIDETNMKTIRNEIVEIFVKEAGATNNDNEKIYNDDQKKELMEFLKKTVQPSKVPTFHHLKNLKQVVGFYLIFYRHIHLVSQVYPKTKKGIDLKKWKGEFLESCMKRKVNIHMVVIYATLCFQGSL